MNDTLKIIITELAQPAAFLLVAFLSIRFYRGQKIEEARQGSARELLNTFYEAENNFSKVRSLFGGSTESEEAKQKLPSAVQGDKNAIEAQVYFDRYLKYQSTWDKVWQARYVARAAFHEQEIELAFEDLRDLIHETNVEIDSARRGHTLENFEGWRWATGGKYDMLSERWAEIRETIERHLFPICRNI